MNQGFTLIELLVVVLIIGILSAVALPQYQTAVERSRATEALTQMSAVRSSAERYHSQHETWPISFDQLDVDIPEMEACSSGYGGKNFCLRFSSRGDDCDDHFCVKALRRRNAHAYELQTAIHENSNGTYSAKRSCYLADATPAQDSEGIAYCNAITGGNRTDF